jgi:F420-non-reducing hydrogenase iron-sulfur subunit
VREKMAEGWEPKIIGFFCNWCSYAGADLAGSLRAKCPPTFLPIRVMCTGRVDPTFILKSLANGADGVLIAGCHPGECHYSEGNYKAQRRVALLKKLLSDLNIDPRRLRLEWISASEGDKFASVIREMTNELKKLGPNPIKEERAKSGARQGV